MLMEMVITTTTKPLNQNKMEIQVITSDSNVGTINCESMYEAHTWLIYLEANGYKCETFVDGISQSLPNNLQHPSTYNIKSE